MAYLTRIKGLPQKHTLSGARTSKTKAKTDLLVVCRKCLAANHLCKSPVQLAYWLSEILDLHRPIFASVSWDHLRLSQRLFPCLANAFPLLSDGASVLDGLLQNSNRATKQLPPE